MSTYPPPRRNFNRESIRVGGDLVLSNYKILIVVVITKFNHIRGLGGPYSAYKHTYK